MIFHNGPKYRYHFIIKELANEYKGEFNCLGEKILRNKKTFSFSEVKKKKLKKSGKSGEEIAKPISYKTKFFDSARFMASPLSNLVDNLAEEIYKTKCTNCDKCWLER